MRKIRAGLDPSGRSCLVEDVELAFDTAVADGMKMAVIHSVDQPSGAPVRNHLLDWAPGVTVGMHRTDTVDNLFVLAGGGDLELDDGLHPFGDDTVIVLTGEVHGWHMGSDGCRMAVMIVPTPPA
jgi:quercetin dioxygenase-like cupin family protein